jgi:prevent-host-death family protein
MEQRITMTELRTKTRNVMEQARFKGVRMIVENFGQPMAAIVGIEEYQRLKEMENRYQAEREIRFERLQQAARANAAASGLSEEEAMALADEIREEVYQGKQAP